jgi:hypothetical protein
MEKSKKDSVVLGEVNIVEEALSLRLTEGDFIPAKMFFKEGELYYGEDGSNTIKVKDPRAVAVFMYNVYRCKVDRKKVEECLSLLYIKLLNKK